MADVNSFKAEDQLGGITLLRFVTVENSNVVEFTTQYMKFYDDKGSAADRRDAEFFWSYEVRNRYPKDDPEFDRLLSQVNSPANEEFWARRTDPVACQLRKQLQAQFGFWAFPREPTEDESKSDPGLLILGDGSRSFVLPGYNLKPVTAIEYPTFVITLLMCNPSHSFTYATITGLWSTLVQGVYHFEKDDVKSAKLREMDFLNKTRDDADTSAAVPNPPTPAPGQTIVHVLGARTLGDEQLKQEIALLKIEKDELRHKVATMYGQLRSKLHK